MRFPLLFLALFVLQVTPATSQETTENFYVGVTAAADDGNMLDGGGLMGLSWSREQVFAAVEAEYAAALASHTHPIAEGRSSTSLSLLAGVRADDNWSIFGRLGLQQDSMPTPDGGTETATGLRLGIGANYGFGGGLSARGELGRRYLDGADALETTRSDFRFALIQSF